MDQTTTPPARPEFGPNGVVANRSETPPTLQAADPNESGQLLRRKPERVWMVLGWLFAGPLNLWALLIVLYTFVVQDDQFIAAFWLVAIPSAIAAFIALQFLNEGPTTTSDIFGLAVKAMFWTAGVLLLILTVITLPIALIILPLGIAYAFILGVPAALLGALSIRIILFKWHPLKKDSQNQEIFT